MKTCLILVAFLSCVVTAGCGGNAPTPASDGGARDAHDAGDGATDRGTEAADGAVSDQGAGDGTDAASGETADGPALGDSADAEVAVDARDASADDSPDADSSSPELGSDVDGSVSGNDSAGDSAGNDGGDASADSALSGTAKFIGHWTMTSGTNAIACSDNTSQTKSLAGEPLEVSAGAGDTLIVSYYCNWNLHLGADDTTTILNPNQSCTSTSAGIMFTFTGQSFALATRDGHNATLTARISATYLEANSTPGTCSLDINAALTK